MGPLDILGLKRRMKGISSDFVSERSELNHCPFTPRGKPYKNIPGPIFFAFLSFGVKERNFAERHPDIEIYKSVE